MSLSTKYRPAELDEIVGQDSIVKILNRQIEINDIKNCYIFSGPSGTGKTTFARAFAKRVNGSLNGIVEVDAASNNGVDNVRALIEQAHERALDAEYKIIIMDEAHMLTVQAWNSFLKTVEEPPKYTIFIFCTTDPHKIPDTIINRCMKFNLSRIKADDIRNRLEYICNCEGYINFNETVDYISRICKGQLRDAVSMLETVSAFSHDLSIQNAIQALGNFSYDLMFGVTNSLLARDEANVLMAIDFIYRSGADIKMFVEQFLVFNMDLLKYSILKDCSYLQVPQSKENELKMSTSFEDASNYYKYYVDKLLELKNMLKGDSNPKSTVEVMLLQMCRLK